MGGPCALPFRMKQPSSIILIGMPGAGKSTIGSKLAAMTGYAFIDTDLIIESIYGMRLQDVADQLPRDDFLDIEAQVILSLTATQSIIATGGSVIYRKAAMDHLKSLGKIIHLGLSLSEVEKRVARNPERGISFGPMQTLEDLYRERMGLYRKFASYECDSGLLKPEECAKWIIQKLHLSALDPPCRRPMQQHE